MSDVLMASQSLAMIRRHHPKRSGTPIRARAFQAFEKSPQLSVNGGDLRIVAIEALQFSQPLEALLFSIQEKPGGIPCALIRNSLSSASRCWESCLIPSSRSAGGRDLAFELWTSKKWTQSRYLESPSKVSIHSSARSTVRSALRKPALLWKLRVLETSSRSSKKSHAGKDRRIESSIAKGGRQRRDARLQLDAVEENSVASRVL